MEQGNAVIGIGIVMVITEVIMALTPSKFDKRRFAVPISVAVAVLLCVIDTFVQGNGIWYQALWAAMLKGFVIAMASGGAYATLKNYTKAGNG